MSPKTEEPEPKKPKLSSCSACLGLFENAFQNKLIEDVVNHEDVKKFDCGQIFVAMSLPMCLQARQLALWFALVEKFDVQTDKEPDVPIKEAIKLIISPIICEKIGKTYDNSGFGMAINITLTHSEEEDTVKKLYSIDDMVFGQHPKGKRKFMSRGYLEKNFTAEKITMKCFHKYLSIPPAVSEETLRVEGISITGPTAFVAGRYRKFSRRLSHSPWVLNGKRVMEDSIEEIIKRNVCPFFVSSDVNVIFQSSGREDVDVRCLGKGRPFVLEIPNSQKTVLPKEIAAQMELDIEKSKDLSVQHLQMVKREELVHIKTGEEKKKKFYRALCALKEPATEELLEKLQIEEPFEIEQITPLRVLHRRPLLPRKRTIYKVKAMVDPENPCVLIVDLVTQAGSYIKELVHGEFGRTSPSLSSIIGKWIDIEALDVIGIDLDWPEEIDNRK